jgi:glycosyltransferase involved in cell wall biosynthesis
VDAIVLTFDTQLGLAELTHKRYTDLWPANPLEFRIPVNGTATGSALTYLEAQPDCHLVPTPSPIGSSMRALLEGIDDETWVFWCIDDRYPTWVDAEALDEICAELDSCPAPVEEVKLLRWRERIAPDLVAVGSVQFVVQQARGREWGFWHHHFIRAGTLRRLFAAERVADDCGIRDVLRSVINDNRRSDRRWHRAPVAGAEGQVFHGRALVPTRPLIRLAEPLKARVLTANGLDELRRNDCEIPPYRSDGQRKIFTWSGATVPDEPWAATVLRPPADAWVPERPVGRRSLRPDVLVVCGEMDTGGTQRVVANVAGGLSGLGYRVAVASFCDEAADFYTVPTTVLRKRMHDVAPSLTSGGEPVATASERVQRRLRHQATRLAGALPDRVRGLLQARAVSWFVTAHARRIPRVRWTHRTIRNLRPATVVSFGPGANVVTLLAAKGLPCRVVISERNDLGLQSRDVMLASMCRWLYREADMVTANSHGALASLAASVPVDRLAYVPNPVAIPPGARTGPPPIGFAGPCVLIVARLVRQKDHQVLLDAFACLPPELDDWRLAIVGSGEREVALRRRADGLRISDRVDFHGRSDDPYAYYRHADIFALPSRFEGMPNALLEAMSFGLPPIVADGTPGPLEVVRDGRTGLVVATGDHRALASAITLLATRPDLRRRLGDAAREEVGRFELGEALTSWTDVLDLRDPGPSGELLR